MYKVNKVNAISCNARSLKSVNSNANKLVEFPNMIYTSDCDIVAVTETWLNSNVFSNEILGDDYVIYRRDRNCKSNETYERGRRVFLAAKKQFHSSKVYGNSRSRDNVV